MAMAHEYRINTDRIAPHVPYRRKWATFTSTSFNKLARTTRVSNIVAHSSNHMVRVYKIEAVHQDQHVSRAVALALVLFNRMGTSRDMRITITPLVEPDIAFDVVPRLPLSPMDLSVIAAALVDRRGRAIPIWFRPSTEPMEWDVDMAMLYTDSWGNCMKVMFRLKRLAEVIDLT